MSNLPEINYHPSWDPVLGPVLERVWPELSRRLNGGEYLPAPADVFRAFRTPLEAVRVLIVGQDPYPTPGHPMGLSFSTQPGVRPPRSLVNIHKELHDDLGLTPPADGSLLPWVDQGVLMLNRVLTVEPGNAGSHRRWGWEAVTEAAISALNRAPMVAILWGKDAQACQRFIPDVPTITSAHPSPLSARRGFFGSRPFSRANAYLQEQNSFPIDWQL
ncbi:uracil-DNA glycosylase [Corynebacterium endometrii]|uniref:Uracil-DNA glycosylase n=1 Tax=Corynebacterium endometrii TaxID=2488819 RepID=A0A4P7QFM0_9CORY|nr:uracil-DNA glycosylase [Corynebacterium endometrii]QCB28329.1 Uracil-DNA glycosylase [Corynebacterium endometrii]